MTGIAFEDFTPGAVIECGPITVTRDELVAFAAEFDPQPFHLDEAAAEATFVGHLIGSGWQSAGFGMRLVQKHVFRGATSMGSPGILQLRWARPVVPGDTLRISVKVDSCRASNTKPDRGFVRFDLTMVNGRDEIVMTEAFTVMFARRGVTPLPPQTVPRSEPVAVVEATDVERLTYLEDTALGTTRDLGAHLFTPEAIIAFATAYDPQVFHLDAQAARQTQFGALCASGWHTAAVWMKRLHLTRQRDIAFTERTGPTPQLGPVPWVSRYALAGAGLCRRYDSLRLHPHGQAPDCIAPRMGARDASQHGGEPARRHRGSSSPGRCSSSGSSRSEPAILRPLRIRPPCAAPDRARATPRRSPSRHPAR